MSFGKVHFKPPPLSQAFAPHMLGLDADMDEVSTIAMIHEHESVLSYMEEHDDPWYNMSVKDQLEQSHCDGSHTTVKWKRKKPPPMSEFNQQLAWQMTMYGEYAGGAPPLSQDHVERITKVALRDKSALHADMKKKKVSPWAQNYQWSRFTAAGEALEGFNEKTRQRNVDEALRAYADETAMAIKSQKLSQKKSMKKEKASEAAVTALANSLLAGGIDKFLSMSSNSSVSSFSSASLLSAAAVPSLALPTSSQSQGGGGRDGNGRMLPNDDGFDNESLANSSITAGDLDSVDHVHPFVDPTSSIPAPPVNDQPLIAESNHDAEEELATKKKKKKKKKSKKKGKSLFGNRRGTSCNNDDDDDNDDDSDDSDVDGIELLDEYDRMKRKMGGKEVAESIAAQLQALSIQTSKAAQVKKKIIDTSLDFFEACDKLRIIKVISLLAAGKGDPNLMTSEDEPLFIHCLHRLLRMDQVTNSLHPEDKEHETSDRKKMQRILDTLVQYGADVNTDRGREGQRPVHLVAANNNTKVMLWLKSLPKIDLEAWSPRDQWTPLIVATRYAHIEMMATLLRCGVNVDGTDALQFTALHHAAAQGHTRASLFLLRVGAKKMLRTVEGKTAAGLAQEGNFLACSQSIASFATPLLSPAEQLQHLFDLEAAKKKKKSIQLRDLGGLLSKKLISGYESMSGETGYYWKQFKRFLQRWWRGEAQIDSLEDDEAFLQELQAAEMAASQKMSTEEANGDDVDGSSSVAAAAENAIQAIRAGADDVVAFGDSS